MFAHEFVRNAYLAGTFIALACGTVGWFVVLRGQVFAGDALSHVAFVGAIAAAVRRLRRARRAVRAHARARRRDGGARAPRPGRRRRDRHRCSPGSSGSGCCCSRCSPRAPPAGAGSRPPTRCSARSTRSAPAGRALAAVIGLAASAGVLVALRPLLLTTLDPELASVRGVPVARARRRASWRCSRSSPPRAPRRSARCCCSGCSPRPAGAAHRAHRAALPRARAVGGDRRRRDVGRARAQLLDRRAASEQRDHRTCRRDLRRRRRDHPPALTAGLWTGWRTRAGVTTRGRRRSPAAGFGESIRKSDEAHFRRARQRMPRSVSSP